jgi:hypothetical protein
MSDTIKLEKSEMPTGQVSVSLKSPLYRDHRNARMHYPMPQSQNERQPSYALEELLLASMLEGINGKQPWKQSRADTIDRLNNLDIEDRQFLVTFFIEAFYISNEEIKKARRKADEIKMDYKQSYTIPAEETPGQEHSVTFRRPNSGVQMTVDKRWQGQSVNGCTLEEMLFAHCLETVDGEPVEQPKDVVSLLDDWTIADVQFLSLVFVNSFSMDDSTEGEKARKLAKQKANQKKGKKNKESKSSQENEEQSSTKDTT